MSWFNVWDGLKNKTCRYLLQRYLGQFLEEKLNLEQLNVELYNGKATVKNVSLKVDALNELFDAQGWSAEVTGGKIGLITVTVPWNALMINDSSIEIFDLFICLRPVQRQNDGTSMLESMWSSVSSSMQLAQECMKQNEDSCDVPLENQKSSIDGLEKFAETIDNVLNRIKAKCSNVVLRLEYLPDGCLQGIAVVVKIKSLNYQNDAETKNNVKLNSKFSSFNDIEETLNDNEKVFNTNIHLLSTFATHNISVNDIYIYTEEFTTTNKNNVKPTKVQGDLNDSKIKLEFPNSTTKSSYGLNESKLQEANAEDVCKSELIPILEIKGQQKIILKMKLSEEINGPKVILDVDLGAICLFVSPRQIHLLSQFYDSFCYDDYFEINSEIKNMESSSSCSKSYGCNMTGDLGNQSKWCDTFEDDSTLSAINRSIVEKTGYKYDGKYCESVSSSLSSSSTVTSSTKFHRKIANMDVCGDISKFNIKVAAIVAVILQEDILVASRNMCQSPLNEKSLLDMLSSAQSFFSMFNHEFTANSVGPKTILSNKNHLCLQLRPIIAEGTQQRNKNILLLKLSITATLVGIYEVLEDKPTSLIDFIRDDNCMERFSKRPELSITMKSTTPFNFKHQGHYCNPPRTDFDIALEKCILELDISIYDRLSAILGLSPFKHIFSNKLKVQLNKTTLKKNKLDACTEVRLATSTFQIKLRFPIVDARPIHDSDRVPWWKQCIRSDFLLVNFHQLQLIFGLNNIEITANEIDVFYCENMETKTHLLKVNMRTVCDSTTSLEPKIEYPKITIAIQKNRPSTSGRYDNLPFSAMRVCRQSSTVHSKHDTSEESETVLLPGETIEMAQFCDTTMKASQLQIKICLPVAILHLESKQLYEIVYNRINSDLFMWEPSSPILNNVMDLESQMKQSIFTGSLLDSLYVPTTVAADLYGSSGCNSDKNSNRCDENIKSNINDDDSIYMSTHEKYKTGQSIFTPPKPFIQNRCSLEVTIGKGNITLFTPTRDAEHRVLPGQLGKFTIMLNTFGLFFVSGHNNNKNLEYLCLHLKDLEVFHCGLIPVDSGTSINIMDSNLPTYMQSTFYKTPAGLTKGNGTGCNKREMLSLVIEIKKLPKQKIKRLKITTGIQKTTLRHNPSIISHTWLNQLIDFLDVKDYPIAGYQPFGMINEIQLHLWDCAIDYRPKNFPFRSVIEIGSFNISSNIISSVTGCTLRFIAEECILSLAPYDNKEILFPDNSVTYIPSTNLVTVLDIGLLDISLRLSEKSTDKCPKFDLRSSIQDVHLRTCSDSGSVLAQFITYLANDGDISNNLDDGSTTSSVISSMYSDAELLEVGDKKNVILEISEQQQERVSQLMAEAVQETTTSLSALKSTQKKICDHGIELYYFPDESTLSAKQSSNESFEKKKDTCELLATTELPESECYELNDIFNFEANVMSNSYFSKYDEVFEALPQVKKDLGDIFVENKLKYVDKNHMVHDDGYCLIADEEKSFMSNFGIKNIKLSGDPLRIVDNHFCLPTGTSDLLKSPENFPMALMRYTLCEMTFTWHLYGGNDFPLNKIPNKQSSSKEAEARKEQKSCMSEAYKHGVSYSKSTQGVMYGKKPKETLTWKTIGGQNRNHEVLVEIQLSKVRFLHEVYPSQTTQASRQVLIVNEIEIRDRLQSSDINKFLYHPKLNNLPNKSNPHMVVIKALHLRPNPKKPLAQECSLRISLLPLRLHIDQDTMLFLAEFFTSLGDSYSNECFQTGLNDDNCSSSQIREIPAPIMMVEDIPEAVQDLHARRLVSTNLDLLMEENNQSQLKYIDADVTRPTMEEPIADDTAPIYFREIIFSPEVLIRFDYHGRRVELSRGPVAGLLMGLGQLQCSEIRLRKIFYKRGLLGIEKLITYLCKEWLKDIKKNQLPNILSGVGPTYAFVQLFQGIYDLFWLPIEQFQKDGRIIRGLQLGAQSFTARTALAALEITARIIQLLQFTAETAFDMVSPGPTVRRPLNIRKGKRRRLQRPKDIREGVTNAYTIVKEGFNNSAQSLIKTAVAEHDQKGYTGAVGAVMRQIPQLVVCPAVLATQATTNILGGVKSSLVPDAKSEAREKWKDDTD